MFDFVKDKYPWLWEVTSINIVDAFNDKVDVLFDEAPVGWSPLILMIAEEIQPIIDREHLDYHIFQIKEKFGQLRWYDNGGNKEIQHIIDSYTAASEHICIICGKPDCFITNTGWIEPICEECYNRNSNFAAPYNEVIDKEEGDKLPETWGYKRYNSESKAWQNFSFNNHRVNTKIRKWWNNNCE